MKELEILRSQRFVIYVAFFTVIFLAPNTYFVFYSFSVFIEPWRMIASGGVALIIASAIMLFTVRLNRKVALNFALFEVMISVYYYIDVLGWSWALIPAFGFAMILPYSVSKYTNEIDSNVIQPPVVAKPIEFESIEALRKDYEHRVNQFMDQNPHARPDEISGKN